MEVPENTLLAHALAEPGKVGLRNGIAHAPGIVEFQSYRPGPLRIVSGYLHPNEEEGGRVVEGIFRPLESGEVEVNNGGVLLIAGNTVELARAVLEGGLPNREHKDNLNRLFSTGERPDWVTGIEEWDRAKLIQETVRVVVAKPKYNKVTARDAHCTRKASTLGSFAMYPFLAENRPNQNFLESLRAMRMGQVVMNPIGQEPNQYTLSGWLAQEIGADAATLELGELRSREASAMVDHVRAGILADISGAIPDISAKPDLVYWQIVRELMKHSDAFKFTDHSVGSPRNFNTFDPLPDGEVYATDIGLDGEEIKHFGKEGERILFPATTLIKKGQRAGVIVKKIDALAA